MSEVIVRFPPSPTGYLHIGGARTAIFNWLYAKKHNGKFILRIEDTDVERSTKESVEGILDGLKWLGLDWDEGPYFQSDFQEEHIETAKRLLNEGKAYKCFCTKEELERKRKQALQEKRSIGYDGTCRNLTEAEIREKEAMGLPYVIRFKVPKRSGRIGYDDQVLGRIEKDYSEIEDFVIVRSNGRPLYLLCNVVDDIRDGITHIIRGQDHMANTIRQILIYEALGKQPPVFAHMPLTLDPKKRKISKRTHGEVVSVQFYREKGFLPWALVNFLVLLGWHTPDNREIFSREELIEAFSLEGISKANSVFNFNPEDKEKQKKFFTDPKALSINAHYLRTIPVEELAEYVERELRNEGLWDESYAGDRREWFLGTIDLIRSRFHTLKDFVGAGRAYFSDEFEIDEKAWKKNIVKHPELKELLPELAQKLKTLEQWTLESTEEVVRDFCESKGVKPGIIINGIRTLITGQLKGPGIFDCMVAIGKDKVIERLESIENIN
ncbi:Glutamyl-tRNA synthetase [Dissulfuribacter thermophilus]|uniref:Glutamate--tRNA ligase n=1 Tax=Dissulfuribacter thermophilus TaxID=1156395 RepID=A0A1B9F7H5_9BACT|nr:glutamate--tRNA ligase [Dissulfuribacter thermophilus]OCC15755.1 Glutamyl-tRNA synthetase [Dissulfuribacter thermophilus]